MSTHPSLILPPNLRAGALVLIAGQWFTVSSRNNQHSFFSVKGKNTEYSKLDYTMLVSPIKTASDLKYQHDQANPDNVFFSRSTMKFHGDTMSNYGVTSKPVLLRRYSGDRVWCWELYRRHPNKKGQTSPAYFDCLDFKMVSYCLDDSIEAERGD